MADVSGTSEADRHADPHHNPNPKRAVDRKLASARARLFTRLDELERRVERAKARFDVRNLIRSHPWPAIGIAVGAGLLVGASKTATAGVIQKQVAGLITGLALHALRTAATRWAVQKFRPEAASGSVVPSPV